MLPFRRIARYLVAGIVAVAIVVGAGFATGVLGVPAVDTIENRFADVDDERTTIDTNLTVDNPNPLGVSAGNLSIDYAISMNDVQLANGSKEGIAIESGQSTLPFRTSLANQRIPEWWYTHVDRGETSEVVVDVNVSHGLLGDRTVSVPQEQTIQTDILGQFNNTTTRPIDADAPLVSDPVLYLNETTATYGDDVTPERTPLDLEFTVYNPKPYPYAVSEVGYEIGMNDVQVGEGSSERGYAIPPKSTRTIEASVVIDNENIDDWWVSHLERDQVTDVAIDVAILIDPDAGGVIAGDVEPIRLDTDAFDYETTIETDIFGTKESDELPPENDRSTGNGTDGDRTGDGAEDGSGTETATPTETGTQSQTGTATESDDSTDTPTGTAPSTPTETDDGVLPLG